MPRKRSTHTQHRTNTQTHTLIITPPAAVQPAQQTQQSTTHNPTHHYKTPHHHDHPVPSPAAVQPVDVRHVDRVLKDGPVRRVKAQLAVDRAPAGRLNVRVYSKCMCMCACGACVCECARRADEFGASAAHTQPLDKEAAKTPSSRPRPKQALYVIRLSRLELGRRRDRRALVHRHAAVAEEEPHKAAALDDLFLEWMDAHVCVV